MRCKRCKQPGYFPKEASTYIYLYLGLSFLRTYHESGPASGGNPAGEKEPRGAGGGDWFLQHHWAARQGWGCSRRRRGPLSPGLSVGLHCVDGGEWWSVLGGSHFFPITINFLPRLFRSKVLVMSPKNEETLRHSLCALKRRMINSGEERGLPQRLIRGQKVTFIATLHDIRLHHL